MKRLMFFFSLIVMQFGCSNSSVKPSELLKEGHWGGDQILLTVGPQQMKLEATCAVMEVPMRPLVGADKTFTVKGTYFHQPGMVPKDYNPANYQQPVLIEGRLEGDLLTIQWYLERDKTKSEVRSLVYNKWVEVFRCP